MRAVRVDRIGGATPPSTIEQWMKRPTPCAPANDNRTPGTTIGARELALEIGWRLTMGIGGLGFVAAAACLVVTAWP